MRKPAKPRLPGAGAGDLPEGKQVAAVGERPGLAVGYLVDFHPIGIEEATMEELGLEVQPLPVPKRHRRLRTGSNGIDCR